MKRLTQRYKRMLLHRQRRCHRQRISRAPAIVSAKRAAAFEMFTAARAMLPEPNLDYESRPGYCVIKPPADMDLSDNYDAVMAFILDMRALFHRRQVPSLDGRHYVRVFADFAAIQSIEPAAGLILAAEVDRWRIASGRQVRSHDHEWQPAVRKFFAEAGLFELLGLEPTGQDEAEQDIVPKLITLQFVRGFSVYGEPGSKLRDRLEQLCGKSIGPRVTVYDAIAEAIANTRHAYPSGTALWPQKLSGRWWASGSWRPEENVVSVQLYDQGVGIPATLPRSDHWSDIVKLAGLGDRLHPERTDERLIEAALAVGRTSTGEAGRGKGLAEMAAWIDKLGNGFLRITSGRGIVVYRPSGEILRNRREAPFPGTLIEWEIGIGD